jgi:hypothetical protein
MASVESPADTETAPVLAPQDRPNETREAESDDDDVLMDLNPDDEAVPVVKDQAHGVDREADAEGVPAANDEGKRVKVSGMVYSH